MTSAEFGFLRGLTAPTTHDLNPLDLRIYILVSAILAAASLAASYAPSRRAAAVDPLEALRHG